MANERIFGQEADTQLLESLGVFSMVDKTQRTEFINSTVSEINSAYKQLHELQMGYISQQHQQRIKNEAQLIEMQIKSIRVLSKDYDDIYRKRLDYLQKEVDRTVQMSKDQAKSQQDNSTKNIENIRKEYDIIRGEQQRKFENERRLTKISDEFINSLYKKQNKQQENFTKKHAEGAKNAAQTAWEEFKQRAESEGLNLDAKVEEKIKTQVYHNYLDEQQQLLDRTISKTENILNVALNKFEKYISPLIGLDAYGIKDLSGSLKKGNQLTYDIRHQYGMYGMDSLTNISEGMTESYKNMKQRGLIVDPLNISKAVDSLKTIVNLQALNIDQISKLSETVSLIQESGVSIDVNSPVMQSLIQNTSKASDEALADLPSEIVQTFGVLSKQYDGLTENVTNSIFANADAYYQLKAVTGMDPDKLRTVYEDLAQASGYMASFANEKGMSYFDTRQVASVMSDVMQMIAGMDQMDVVARRQAMANAGFSNATVNLFGEDLYENIDKAVLAVLSESSFIDNLANVQDPLLQRALQQSGLLTNENSMGIAKMFSMMTDDQKDEFSTGLSDAVNEVVTQQQRDQYILDSQAKLTDIDKANIKDIATGWMNSSDYENTTKEFFATSIQYIEDIWSNVSDILGLFNKGNGGIIGSALGSFLGVKAGSGGLLSGLVGGGTAAASGGGIAAAVTAAMPWAIGAFAAGGILYAINDATQKQIEQDNAYYSGAYDTVTSQGEANDSTGSKHITEGQQLVQRLEYNKDGTFTYQDPELVSSEEAKDIQEKNESLINQYMSSDTGQQNYEIWKNSISYPQAGLIPEDDLKSQFINQKVITNPEQAAKLERSNEMYRTSLPHIYELLGIYPKDERTGADIFSEQFDYLLDLAKQGKYVDLSDWYKSKVFGIYFDGKFGDMRGLQDPSRQLSFDDLMSYKADTVYPQLFPGVSNEELEILKGMPFSEIVNSGKIDLNAEFANGISAVPYNGFPAILHQGEMVIPSKKANYIRALFGQKPLPTSGVPETQLTGNNSFVQSIPNYTQGQTPTGPQDDSGMSFAYGDDAVGVMKKMAAQGVTYGQMDCSDSVSDAYIKAGVGVPDSNCRGIYKWDQYGFGFIYDAKKNNGSLLSKQGLSQLSILPGDVILMDLNSSNDRYPDHVSLATGGGKMIHSYKSWDPNGRGGPHESGYWNDVVAVLRYGSGGTGESTLDLSNINYISGNSSINSQANGLSGMTGIPNLGIGSITDLASAQAAFSNLLNFYGYGDFNSLYSALINGASVSTPNGTIGGGTGSTSYPITGNLTDGSALESNTYRDLIYKYSEKHGLDPRIVYGMIMKESSGNPNAISSGGRGSHKGLMQVNQGKVDALFGPGANIFDPETNIATGTSYLESCIKQTGSVVTGVGGYNAGPGYEAWKNLANAIKTSTEGQDLASIMQAGGFLVVSDRKEMEGNPKNIKTSYISDVYRNAGYPLQVPYLAKGGIVDSPTLAMIGEGPNNEAVTPLNRDNQLLGLDNMTNSLLDGMDELCGHILNKLNEVISAINSINTGGGDIQRAQAATSRARQFKQSSMGNVGY